MIWAHASKQNPCPICNKTDWCTFGDRAMLCQRVESQHPHKSGGWFHFYDSDKPQYIPQAKAAPKQLIKIEDLIQRWMNNTSADELASLANNLGVTYNSLEYLDVCWAKEHKAFAFPMCDSKGNRIGIRLRSHAGFKWAVTGSREGIFLPISDTQEVAWLPEGPTDTAALLSLGCYAIGRPTCHSGNSLIVETLNLHKIRRAVVVADNDDLKRFGPDEQRRPGIDGALKLKVELGKAKIKSVIWIPPTKDSREFLKAGGTRVVMESDIKNKVWT